MSKLTNNERIDEAVKRYKNELPRLVKALNRILKNAEADEDLFAVGKINPHFGLYTIPFVALQLM